MSNLEAKRALEFQRLTADRVIELFKGQNKVLVADEVGMGKTFVAKSVINTMFENKGGKLNVVYFSPSETVGRQNFRELAGEESRSDKEAASTQRLSMQHYYSRNVGEGLNIYSFSPVTSLSSSTTFGTIEERELSYRALEIIFAGSSCDLELLKVFLSFGDSKKFAGIAQDKDYMASLEKITSGSSSIKDEPEFEELDRDITALRQSFRLCETLDVKSDFSKVNIVKEVIAGGMESGFIHDSQDKKQAIEMLADLCMNLSLVYNRQLWFSEKECSEYFKDNDIYREIFFNKFKNMIRMESTVIFNPSATREKLFYLIRVFFVKLSLKFLDIDLVIIDEFHRYLGKSLRVKIDSLFNKSKILLLSATPYNIKIGNMTEFNEPKDINEKRYSADLSSLSQVVSYMSGEKEKDLGRKFGDLSSAVQDIASESKAFALEPDEGHREELIKKWAVGTESRDKLNDKLKQYICRTERYMCYENIAKGESIIDTKLYDFSEAEITDEIKAALICKPENLTNNMAYIKTTPYFLSFAKFYESLGYGSVKDKEHYLKLGQYRFNSHGKFKDSVLWDGKPCLPKYLQFQALNKEAMPENISKVAWIPPINPYYELEGPFRENSEYTKTLVFARYTMTTKAIAAIFSRIAGADLQGDVDETKLTGIFDINDEDILRYSKMYNRDKVKLSKLSEIVEHIRRENSCDEFSAYMAVASPVVCAFRSLFGEKKDAEGAIKYSRIIGKTFEKYLLQKDIYNAIGHKESLDVLKYCASGCIQSMIDEFIFMISQNYSGSKKEMAKIAYTFTTSIQGFDSLDKGNPNEDDYFKECEKLLCGETGHSKIKYFGRDQEIRNNKIVEDNEHFILCGFAERFSEDISDSGGHYPDRIDGLQQAFNSPFRPFILAATPSAQEGLNLHWYSHKIMHANLPNNPVDFEQREGRINRFNGHIIRKRAFHRFGHRSMSWKSIFKNAELVPNSKYGMYPNWYIDDPEYKISRIIVHHGLSKEEERYEQLMELLPVYRLSLGYGENISDIEYIKGAVDLLNGKEGKEKYRVEDLMINLSPAFNQDRGDK